MVTDELNFITTEDILNKEFNYYKTAKSRLNNNVVKTEIIKFFQQDSFFAVEKELFKNEKIKQKIIANRCKYLFKSEQELINNDILTGFKKSGIHYGYSHFNPLLFKWFIEQYNVKKCADPFGGWGHRLLGGLSLEKYYYNDLSYNTCCGVQDIINYFDIKNTDIYNMDSEDFLINSGLTDYDAIFTCPPYYNLEHYECGDFLDMDEYISKLDAMEFAFTMNPNCKVMGIVIREDMIINSALKDYTEKHPLKLRGSTHLLNTTKKRKNEYLYIYKKEAN